MNMSIYTLVLSLSLSLSYRVHTFTLSFFFLGLDRNTFFEQVGEKSTGESLVGVGSCTSGSLDGEASEGCKSVSMGSLSDCWASVKLDVLEMGDMGDSRSELV